MNIKNTVTELIGDTPLLRLKKMEERFGARGEIVAKVELFNPAGSIKDRVGYNMIIEAEKSGRLKPGGTIIEPTSGNTGIGLSAVAASKGYGVIIVMPETMSAERRALISAYGAKLVLTDGAAGMKGAIARAEELAAEIPGSFIAGQFENPANPQSHFETTGPEIWEDSGGDVDIFVSGVGTGGTVTGVGHFLKSKKPSVKVVAVEPAGSAVLSGCAAGAHGIQGIGAGFVPEVLDTEVYDEIIKVSEADAYAACRLLGKSEGVLAGISSGAALHAALSVARRSGNAGKTVVVLLPDTGERYLSSGLFAE